MKTNRIVLMALACVAAISCAKEIETPSTVSATTFVAEKEDFTTTKTVLNGKKVEWTAGDAIAVYGDAAAVKFTTASAGATATFTSEAAVTGSSFLMVSPFEAAKGVQSGKLLVTVPENQTPVAGSFDPAAGIAVASATDLGKGVKFNNALALLRLNIPSSFNGKVAKITVEAKGGESLSGDILVDPASMANTVTAGASSVSLVATSVMASGQYYVAIRPCAISSGVKLSVLCADKTLYTRESEGAFTFNVNTIYDMGNVGTTGWTVATTQYSVHTVLGSLTNTDNTQIVTGTGSAARLRSPEDIAMAPDGNFWISTRFNPDNHGVWKMTPDYTLSKIVVSSENATLSGSHAWGTTFAPDGTFYLVAKGVGKIMTVTENGEVNVVDLKAADGSAYSVVNPMKIEFDKDGNMYVLYRTKFVKFKDNVVVKEWATKESYNDYLCFTPDKKKAIIFGYQNIYELDLNSEANDLVKIAGTGAKHTNAATYTDGTLGNPFSATLNVCNGAVCLADGTIIFGDSAGKTVRALIPAVDGDYKRGSVITILGSPWKAGVAANAEASGCNDGLGTSALMSYPGGMCLDSTGAVLAIDGLYNGMVRRITTSVVVEDCDMSGTHQDYAGTDGMVSIF